MSRRSKAFERVSVLAAGIAVVFAAFVIGLRLTSAVAHGQPGARCTHGASSVGPVFIRNGKVVGGDTTPRTEACLP